MRPRLLQLDGEKDFEICQNEFALLFPSSATTDVLGNKIIFSPDACHHICFKLKDKRNNIGPRTEWEQERAERVLWVKEALTAPNFIRPAPGNAWAYLLQVSRDKENNLPGGLYVVIAHTMGTTPQKRGTLQFVTAHPITMQQWDNYRKTRPWIYPDFGQEPPIQNKQSKNKNPKSKHDKQKPSTQNEEGHTAD